MSRQLVADNLTERSHGGSGRRVMLVILLALCTSAATFGGIELRRWAWNATTVWRTTTPVDGVEAGQLAARVGVLQAYTSTDTASLIHLPPLRLLVFQQWIKWTGQHAPQTTYAANDFGVLSPLLYLNTACELSAALLLGGLVFVCLRRAGTRTSLTCAAMAGFVSFSFTWFNPAVIWAGHCSPVWTSWALPFLLLAALLATVNAWFLAAFAMVGATLISAEAILIAPLFVLWPIFTGKMGVIARSLTGLIVAGGGVLLASFLLTSHLAWVDVCFLWPWHHDPAMTSGPVSNLPAILSMRYGLQSGDRFVTDARFLPHVSPVAIKLILAAIYGATLLCCSIGGAIQSRRNDPRLLVALCAPFVLLVALLPGMGTQAMVWPAAISALLIGCGMGTFLLHLLITALACTMMLHDQLGVLATNGSSWTPKLHTLLQGGHPDLGWVLVMVALTLLYLSMTPRPKAEWLLALQLPGASEGAARRPGTDTDDDLKLLPWRVEAPSLLAVSERPSSPQPLEEPTGLSQSPRHRSGFIAPPKVIDLTESAPQGIVPEDPSTVWIFRDDT